MTPLDPKQDGAAQPGHSRQPTQAAFAARSEGPLCVRRLELPPGLAPWRALLEIARGGGGGRAAGGGAWLDSALSHRQLGRWSFAAAGPVEVIEVADDDDSSDDGLEGLRVALARLAGGEAGGAESGSRWRAAREALGVPFAGGAIGYLSYDLGRRLERVRPPVGTTAARRASGFPLLRFGLYPHVAAWDAANRRLVLAGQAGGFEGAYEAARAAVVRAAGEAAAGARREASALGGGAGEPGESAEPGEASLARQPAPLACGCTGAEYLKAVRRAQELIRAGDIFEVNLAQRFDGDLPSSMRSGDAREHAAAVELYLRVRRHAAGPFMALLLEEGGRAVLSASPERFLAVQGRELEARPIKGTRPRGRTPAEDRRLRDELAASPKERAELAMIVDLFRNDLGRVARPGSVRVVEAAERMRFPAVHHLVGHVRAELGEGRTGLDAVRAAFPSGSITGAPKPRAMEVIDELEPVRRAVYTGSIGWIGPDLDLDLNVAIRTIAVEAGRAWFSVGGAITVASDPHAELEETLVKGRALARALGARLPEPPAPGGRGSGSGEACADPGSGSSPCVVEAARGRE